MEKMNYTKSICEKKRWGQEMGKPSFKFVPQKRSQWNHLIGGDHWRCYSQISSDVPPTLILTLDISDPILRSIKGPLSHELPLCSYIDWGAVTGNQVYTFTENTREVVFHETEHPPYLPPEDNVPYIQLQEVPGILEPISSEYLCIDEEHYWMACDTFLTTSDKTKEDTMIRVLGEPVWLQWVVEEYCRCGRKMFYLASIGYDVADNSPYQPGRDFFLWGEFGLYFFFCPSCNEIHVHSQSS